MSVFRKPEDGTTGSQPPADPPKDPPKDPPAPEKTFTQTELDRIVKERLARAVPEDYETAKEKAARLDALEEKSKSDLQKAQEAAAKATQERDSAFAERDRTRRESAISLEAAAQNADAELVAMALAADTTIKVENGQLVGVKEAVTALLERKPNLKIGANRTSGGEFGGNDSKTIVEKIQALERKGDRQSLIEARALKIQQGLMT